MTAPVYTLVSNSVENLITSLPIEKGRVTSKRVLKAQGARMVRLSIDAGSELTEHSAPVPILIQALSGTSIITVADEKIELSPGGIVHVDAAEPHAVHAVTEAHLLLTLLDGHASPRGSRHDSDTHVHEAARAQNASAAPVVAENTAPASDSTQNLVLATSGADSRTVDEIQRWHRDLAGSLAARATQVLDAASTGHSMSLRAARGALVAWCRETLLAGFNVEADALYPAVRSTPEGTLLTDVLSAELEKLTALVDTVETSVTPTDLASATVSLRITVARHLNAEAERLLPSLAASPHHSLTQLWATMEHTSSATSVPTEPVLAPPPAHSNSAAHTCECGVADDPNLSATDARSPMSATA